MQEQQTLNTCNLFKLSPIFFEAVARFLHLKLTCPDLLPLVLIITL